jgi:hypothetical protein
MRETVDEIANMIVTVRSIFALAGLSSSAGVKSTVMFIAERISLTR